MRRRGGPLPAAGIRLFPLLSVLICTTGALVTLLVGFARQGQQALDAAARESGAEQDEREGLEWRIGELQKSRDKTQADLNSARMELSHFEDHLRRLHERADRLRRAIAEMERLEPEKRGQELTAAAELERLRGRLRAAEQAVAAAQRDAVDKPVKYSVVPYEGPFRTNRRPIYLECRADRVILQPEGIEFTELDFQGPMGPGNPIASALRAAREYLAAAQPDLYEKQEPYPLLIVRPDAIEAYYHAQLAVQSWGSQFGYELVGADWQLDFPEPDPQMAVVMHAAIADARVRQQQLIAAAPSEYKRAKPSFRVKPNGGGIEVDPSSRSARGRGGANNPYKGLARAGGNSAARGAGNPSGANSGGGPGGGGNSASGNPNGGSPGTGGGAAGGNSLAGGQQPSGGNGPGDSLAGGNGSGGAGAPASNMLAGGPGGGALAMGAGQGAAGGNLSAGGQQPGGGNGFGGQGAAGNGLLGSGNGPGGGDSLSGGQKPGIGNGLGGTMGSGNSYGGAGSLGGNTVAGGQGTGSLPAGAGAGSGNGNSLTGGSSGGQQSGLGNTFGGTTGGGNGYLGVGGAGTNTLAGGPGGGGQPGAGTGGANQGLGAGGPNSMSGTGGNTPGAGTGANGNGLGTGAAPGTAATGGTNAAGGRGPGTAGGAAAQGNGTADGQPGDQGATDNADNNGATADGSMAGATGAPGASTANGSGGSGPSAGGMGSPQASGNSPTGSNGGAAGQGGKGPASSGSGGQAGNAAGAGGASGPAAQGTGLINGNQDSNLRGTQGGKDLLTPQISGVPTGGDGSSSNPSSQKPNSQSAGRQGGGSQSSGSQSGGSPGGQSGSSGSSQDISTMPPQSSAVGMPSMNFQKRPPESLAKSRGEDWALPDSSHSSVPVSRPVIIECRADRLLVLADDGKTVSKEILFGQKTTDSVDELRTAVWAHMKDWGAAGKGLYWKPTLSVRVTPDGRARFEELQSLFADSGLAMRESTRTAAPPPPPPKKRWWK